jgi:uncharacterized radical SAM superfamily Fe-S cluster-containing enzyme
MKNVAQPLIKDRTVSSLCPTCLKVINARIFQDGEAVMIDKRCEEHGDFRDAYWSDVTLYKRFMSYWIDGSCIDGSSQSPSRLPIRLRHMREPQNWNPSGEHRCYQQVQPVLPGLFCQCG